MPSSLQGIELTPATKQEEIKLKIDALGDLAKKGNSDALELLARIRNNKASLYCPHAMQDAFHRSSARIRLFQGGNRSGKSTAGALEFVSFLLGYRPWLDRSDPNYHTPIKPPVIGRIICEDFKATASNVIIPKLREWLPPDQVKRTRRNQVGVEAEWELHNGSKFFIMTNEQDDSLFESSDIDVVWFDEPPRRPVFIGTWRGLTDRMGYCWLCMTPLKEPWIYDELVIPSKTKDSIDVFFVETTDNVGYGLTAEAVEEFGSMLSEDEKKARLHGRFRHLAGMIYKEFDPEIHVVEPFAVPKDWPVWVLIDPHPRNPHMVLWGTVDPYSNKYVIDELYSDMLIPELCRSINERNNRYSVTQTLIDQSAYVKSPVDGSCWADEFSNAGILVEPAPKDLVRGIPAVKRELVGTNGKPRLYFFSNLERVLWEIPRYSWQEWRGRSNETRAPREKPIDKDDHAMECLYRFILIDPQWRNMRDDDMPLAGVSRMPSDLF